MAITKREQEQIEKANASGKTPVVFIHGLWLLPSSWDRWAAVFEEAGYAALTPVWPDDPETVEEARANPDVLAKKTIGRVAGHTAEVIGQLQKKSAVLGHSTGGLLAQIIAGRGLSAVTVAIDPGPFRGVLPLPFSTLKVSAPVLSNPLNRGRAVTLTFDQFPDRGPLLILDGEKDHTVPWAIANASYKRQKRNTGVTEIKSIPNRGHSLTIDSGWREVCDTALEFVKRFTGDDAAAASQ